MTGFGKRLRDLRVGKKLTQKQLAKIIKISESAVGMYERGEREPSFEITGKIAEYFEVSVDWLSYGKTVEFKDSIEELNHDIDLHNISDILNKYNLKVDGKQLTEEEAKGFLSFVRANRSLN
ncbi:helix-turn-helix domain-containing protein [Paenibacillus tyrfis]|uniref:HTH cro/C1-type domain-containing protein n=1 Tax=Paenibacillus tyrfis TaxID=1501230 RepID=A0A081P4C3_9BACL|nr:helix-turn-helix transcriptional regulator [Paenibacillus tyrfis]KEQ25546.1 hypothetical protein ET33_02150 [Paenibacillus tyrfis]